MSILQIRKNDIKNVLRKIQIFKNNDGESASTNEKGMGKLNTRLSLA